MKYRKFGNFKQKKWLSFDDAWPYMEVERNGSDGWYSASCPSHVDDRPSLGFKEGNEGELVVICHAGCATVDIIKAVKELMV